VIIVTYGNNGYNGYYGQKAWDTNLSVNKESGSIENTGFPDFFSFMANEVQPPLGV